MKYVVSSGKYKFIFFNWFIYLLCPIHTFASDLVLTATNDTVTYTAKVDKELLKKVKYWNYQRDPFEGVSPGKAMQTAEHYIHGLFKADKFIPDEVSLVSTKDKWIYIVTFTNMADGLLNNSYIGVLPDGTVVEMTLVE